MSSFINKSGKKFTPKAPARRRAPAAASIAKPPSQSGTAEPSSAPQSEAGSEYADRQQTPAALSSQGAVEPTAPSIELPEASLPVKPSAPLVDSNGIPIVRESSVARTTGTQPTSTPSASDVAPQVVGANVLPPGIVTPTTRVRSRSPVVAATSKARSSKRRRVDADSAPQSANPQTQVPRSRSPVSLGSHDSTALVPESPTQLSTEALRSTTPVLPVATTLPQPVRPPTNKQTSKSPASAAKARQFAFSNEAPAPTNAHSSSKTTQSPGATHTPKSTPPPRPSQASKVAQAAKTSQARRGTRTPNAIPSLQSSASEPIVDYEVPGQPPSFSPSRPSTSGHRSSNSKSTTPARTPRPRVPSAVEDDQWQVTTPADLAASGRIDERRSRGRVEQDDDDSVDTGGTTTPKESHVASNSTSSARLANAVKRKRKQMARNAALSRLTGPATAAAIDEAVAASIEGQLPRQLSVRPERPLTEQEPSGPKKRVPKRGVREPTPDENEMVVIAPGITRMNDLTQDMRVGAKSDREKKMRAIDWKDVKRRRKEDEIRQATHRGRPDADGRSINGGGDDEDDGLDEDERLERNYERHKQTQGLQSLRVRNVNGEQVLDEASQFIDRHAMQEEELLEEVEEDDLTKKFNVATYATWRRKDPAERVLTHEKWTDDATDRFYDFLSQFGTDFMIISKMFNGRTRRHIKAKFVKEERADPDRIKQALMRHLTRNNEGDGWSIEAFRVGAGLSQSDLKDPVAVEQELEEIKVKKEEEIEEARKETAENEKQMRLAGLWISDEEDEYGSDGEPLSPETIARKRKEREIRLRRAKKEEKKLRKRADKMGPPTGGDEEEIVETIEGDEL